MDEAFLARGRAFLEGRMRDTCRITKPGTGARVKNEETGTYTDPDPVTVYEGKCRIPRRSGATTSTSSAGSTSNTGTAWQVGEYPLAIPIDAPGSADVRPGHTVTYLTAADDPALVGQVFGITEPSRQSAATERRFKMKQVVGVGGS